MQSGNVLGKSPCEVDVGCVLSARVCEKAVQPTTQLGHVLSGAGHQLSRCPDISTTTTAPHQRKHIHICAAR